MHLDLPFTFGYTMIKARPPQVHASQSPARPSDLYLFFEYAILDHRIPNANVKAYLKHALWHKEEP